VLALEERNTDALAKISTEITAAIRDDRAEAIVLGCAGMADLANELAATHGLPVIDGVAAAVTLAESLVRLGLKTSRLGPYATPRSKTYSGPFAPFQP
jgi:allantoin racemase